MDKNYGHKKLVREATNVDLTILTVHTVCGLSFPSPKGKI